MVVKTIFVIRHGFRGTWDLDLGTGVYTSKFSSPTKIPGDPALTAYGVQQSHQLATALSFIFPPIVRIYSSPYYRCLETILPAAEKLGLSIHADHGLGEWYGQAPFKHPEPAQPQLLASLFPALEVNYAPSCRPPATGESVAQLYTRIALALSYVIADADLASGDEEIAMAICTHAAPLIIIGRVLTGSEPTNIDEPDFKTYTAGLTRFERKSSESLNTNERDMRVGEELPDAERTENKDVRGGWDCVLNCDCTHLEGGEERGWFFTSDESFFRANCSDEQSGDDEKTSKL